MIALDTTAPSASDVAGALHGMDVPSFDGVATDDAAPRGASLRLAAAAGMGRGFLFVHFPAAAVGASWRDARALTASWTPRDETLHLADDGDRAQALVAELRELGGMSVIA